MGLIPDEIISQVLDRCDIVETVNSYIPLKRVGRNYKACCPFHNEKTPSFLVSPDKQIFHCFGCGAGGNTISFVMKQDGVEFPDAVRTLANKVGINIPNTNYQDTKTLSLKELLYKTNDLAVQFFNSNLLTSKEPAVVIARDYLKGRGLSVDIVNKLNMGFACDKWDSLLTFLRAKDIGLSSMEKAGLVIPKENRGGFYDRFRNRIIFPICDIKSRCVGFGARAMKEGIAKYINSPETILYTKSNHLYGLNLAKEAIRNADFAIVVEGYMDFIIPYQAGVENIVASLGTALTIEQIRLLRRYTRNVVMLFDTDKAGESATVRSLDSLIEEEMNVKVATLKAGEDPDSFVRKFGVKEFSEHVSKAKPLFDYKINVLMGQYSHKSVDGKAMISSSMLPTIAKYRNAVVKFSYVKKLAEVLSVPEEALLMEMQKLPRGLARNSIETPKKAAIWGRSNVLERDLLKLILHDESCIPVVKENIILSDFQDEKIKRVITRMFDLFDENKDIKAANLIRDFQDEHIVRMLSELMASEYNIVGNKEKMLEDYIKGFRKNRIKRERQDLTVKLKLAEASGNQTAIDNYLKKYNQSLKMR